MAAAISIHCQASIGPNLFWLLPSAPCAMAQFASCEAVMPNTIASCCSEASRPRYSGGATSAM